MLRWTSHRLPVSRILTAKAVTFRPCFTGDLRSSSPFENNTQLKDLVKANRIGDARRLFDEMSHRDEISWTTIVSGYVAASNPIEALSLFSSFLAEDSLYPDPFIISLAIKACGSTPSLLAHGRAIHALTLKSGAFLSVFVGSALLDMYSRSAPSDTSTPLQVFDEMPVRNVVTWTSAVAALVRAGKCCQALLFFADMSLAGVPFDSHTYAIALKACADDGLSLSGREIHARAFKEGQEGISFVSNGLVTLYSKSGDLRSALAVFARMRSRDVASWTTLISTYSQTGWPADAVATFIQLLAHPNDGAPNDYTYAAVISACAALAEANLGAQLHAQVARRGFAPAASVSNALVSMYARAGLLPSAVAAFRETPAKDLVSWSAVISAHAQEGLTAESFGLFEEMRRRAEAAAPTEYTLASLLSACACNASLEAGQQAHARAIAAGLEAKPMVTSALIAMYGKSGNVDAAAGVFSESRPTDTVSWTAMITGFAEHGRNREAIQLFDEMRERKIEIDPVTLLGVLTACSHGGMVDEGLRYFDAMRGEGMEPEKEHYGCVVDMLGRAGRVKEAERIVERLPEGMADEVAWTAILRSCEGWGEVEVGSRAAGRAVEVEPGGAGVRVAMANLYAKERRWREAAAVRKEMREKGVRKEVGWSWVAGSGGEVEVFVAAGREHPRAEEVYQMIELVDFGARVAGRAVEMDAAEHGDVEFEHSLLNSANF
ncbi:Putative pentatricopeptide repeat-containing protein [Apostasia shenzhenica]|uniref:Pentatricopeptide repeat-containing protein n=1 Tax=Apostasia shenzhenica TaxID=1088818 RepID=A0A2I0BFK1_9ASPA|nr:Putative pentatricopeptide repeat-containing protein [Apostasia shenzhenica]